MTNDVGNASKTEAVSNLLEHRWTFMDDLEPQVGIPAQFLNFGKMGFLYAQ